jgi:hypothetical protein
LLNKILLSSFHFYTWTILVYYEISNIIINQLIVSNCKCHILFLFIFVYHLINSLILNNIFLLIRRSSFKKIQFFLSKLSTPISIYNHFILFILFQFIGILIINNWLYNLIKINLIYIFFSYDILRLLCFIDIIFTFIESLGIINITFVCIKNISL